FPARRADLFGGTCAADQLRNGPHTRTMRPRRDSFPTGAAHYLSAYTRATAPEPLQGRQACANGLPPERGRLGARGRRLPERSARGEQVFLAAQFGAEAFNVHARI